MQRPTRRFTIIASILGVLGALAGVCSVDVMELVCLVNEQEAQPLSAMVQKEVAAIPSLTQVVAYKPKARGAEHFQSEKSVPNDVICVDGEADSLIEAMPEDDSLEPADASQRKNPFEFGITVAFEKSDAGVERVENLKLYGFVGNAPSRAIIHASGQTKTLAAGERWGVIEMLEVKPPEVRIRVDGVTRTWSLLGKQSGTLE